MSLFGDIEGVQVDEKIVIQKFNGDGTNPEDEVERVHIHNGEITHVEKIENGVVVATTYPEKEVA